MAEILARAITTRHRTPSHPQTAQIWIIPKNLLTQSLTTFPHPLQNRHPLCLSTIANVLYSPCSFCHFVAANSDHPTPTINQPNTSSCFALFPHCLSWLSTSHAVTFSAFAQRSWCLENGMNPPSTSSYRHILFKFPSSRWQSHLSIYCFSRSLSRHLFLCFTLI